MRIIAGVAKGRILGAVADATRPTSDRAREGLFSSLTSEFGTFEGLRVLDLFGGSGAIGLESLSRGATSVHIVEKDEVNAFALPNNHLVVYTGLITDCKKQEALQGVLGHEIAHIEKNHVMKKLSKEVGLSVLLSATAGGKGGQILKGIFKTLSSTAYDRALEKEADMSSVKYMLAADINPEPMADFMYELAQKHDTPDGFGWISTHPESEERAKYILDYLKGKKYEKKQTMTQKEWDDYKNKINDL